MGDGISNYERFMGLFRKNDPEGKKSKPQRKQKPKRRKKSVPWKHPPVFQQD